VHGFWWVGLVFRALLYHKNVVYYNNINVLSLSEQALNKTEQYSQQTASAAINEKAVRMDGFFD
jgi:hypothetical protein